MYIHLAYTAPSMKLKFPFQVNKNNKNMFPFQVQNTDGRKEIKSFKEWHALVGPQNPKLTPLYTSQLSAKQLRHLYPNLTRIPNIHGGITTYYTHPHFLSNLERKPSKVRSLYTDTYERAWLHQRELNARAERELLVKKLRNRLRSAAVLPTRSSKNPGYEK
jgi:hypothetical protein